MRQTLTVFAAVVGLLVGAGTAQAATIVIGPFSGTGTQGNLDTTNSSEPWLINCSGLGPNNVPCPVDDFGWGSPGVAETLTPYTGTTAATDFEITFDGFAIDPSQIGLASAPGCAGREQGGTVFCTDDLNPWTVVYDPTTPDSLAFFAPAGQSLAPGQEYFVNIFLEGDSLPTSISFTGGWTAETAVPEPASMVLLGTGLAALVARRRKAAPKR